MRFLPRDCANLTSGFQRTVDLSTEKEIATFPMEQAWSGLAFSPDRSRIYVSSGAAYPGSDITLPAAYRSHRTVAEL
jgi:hypothetical protein